MDLYSKKKATDLDLIFSLIPDHERILFISEKISNRKIAILIGSTPFIFVYLFYLLLYIPLLNESFLFWISKSIFYIVLDFAFLSFYTFIAYFFGSKNIKVRKDFYLIFTEEFLYTLMFSAKYKSPVLKKNQLSKDLYFKIEKRLFGKTVTLILYDLAEQINESKFKRIKDYKSLQKLLDSIFFHFGQSIDQKLLDIRYDLPFSLKISKNEYDKIKKRRKNVYTYFEISTPIVFIVGVLIMVIISDPGFKLFVLLIYSLLALAFFGTMAIIYIIVLIELKRCSSLDEQMVIKKEGIEYNNIKIPFNEHMLISTSYISSRNTTQTPQNPKNSIYAIIIYDDVASDTKRYFGPIDDFQNCFKFLYSHFMKWKNENGHTFSKEELYENEIKR